MDTTHARRPFAALIALAAAITLMMGAMAPSIPTPHAPSTPQVVTQAVALTANPLAQIWDVFTGVDATHPLPAGSNPIAPITEQVLRSVATYSGQLLSGQGHLIPGEIATQVKNFQDALPTVQALLIDDIAVIPVSAFSAFFLTAMVIGSLPASLSALPGLAEILLRAVLVPPLKWVYNGFAIRNAIATALQPPTAAAPEPEPAAAAAAAAASQPVSRGASSARGITPKASTPPAKRTTAPASKRSAKPATAASSTPAGGKNGVAGSGRQR